MYFHYVCKDKYHVISLSKSHPFTYHYTRTGKKNATNEFWVWKNYYDVYYLKHGGVGHGKLQVYENVEVVRMGRPRVRPLKTPSSMRTRPHVKHMKHGLGS